MHGLHPNVLRERLDRDGGFTIEARTGVALERGIAVCLEPSRSWTFDRAEWRDDAVRSWLERHAAQDRTVAIGGWLDQGTVWLDRVRVVPSALRPVAAALGRRRRQVAVFDLRQRQLVRLGARARAGSGRRPAGPSPRSVP
jgi:hypothetical protein